MTALARRRRNRTMLMVAANVVALAVLGGLLWFGRTALGDYTAAKRADRGLVEVAVPATPTAMFATVDVADQLTSVTVFVLAPSLAGGSIVSVPVHADSTQGAGAQRVSLRDAYASGGRPGLVLALESLLSVSLDYDMIADPSAAAAVLGPVAPIEVDLARTVVNDADGATKVLFQRGARSLGAADVVAVLTAMSTTVDEAARIPNIEAVWSGVATAIGQGTTVAAAGAPVADFAGLVEHLFAGAVGSRGLPLGVFPGDVPNVGDNDVAPLDRAEEILVFASIAPGSMSRPADGLAIRIVAPPGSEARVKQAVAVFLYSGDNVASVDLTATPRDAGEVFLYDESSKAHFDELRAYVGPFEYGTPDSQPLGIDATIELGKSFLDSSEPVASPVTTSSTLVSNESTPVGVPSGVAPTGSVTTVRTGG